MSLTNTKNCMLDKLFNSLRNEKTTYLNAKKGSEFEERISNFLKMKLGFGRILKEDISDENWKLIKKHLADKLAGDFIDLPEKDLAHSFIYQPFGSQEFPDFLIFTDKKIIPLEIKFSADKQSKPMWNSNVPKANAFYVFGSYGKKDLTFFCGKDVLSEKHRASLYTFFSQIRTVQNNVRRTMPKLDITNRGFTPYIRAAYDQTNHKPEVQTSFFAHTDRKKVEDLAIDLAAKL